VPLEDYTAYLIYIIIVYKAYIFLLLNINIVLLYYKLYKPYNNLLILNNLNFI
jgi:hypothetical protein